MISEISYDNTTRATIHNNLHGEKRKQFYHKDVVQINGQLVTDVVYDKHTIFTAKKGKTGTK